jgi:hypothetical protein
MQSSIGHAPGGWITVIHMHLAGLPGAVLVIILALFGITL